MKQCELCGKGSKMSGTRTLLRGHYNPTNWTRKYPNLQKSRDSEGKRVLACVKCMRTMVKPARAPRATRVKETPAKSPAGR